MTDALLLAAVIFGGLAIALAATAPVWTNLFLANHLATSVRRAHEIALMAQEAERSHHAKIIVTQPADANHHP